MVYSIAYSSFQLGQYFRSGLRGSREQGVGSRESGVGSRERCDPWRI
ncbi:hypothetical protein BJP36_35595 [Moorena producens JHB]|uniref:Uncharacterized protein n=1 Tax=Moorena producens (strain JHB) TaxID=1454205 RepID=A0A9Q9STL8_MOOP1|nr:hypothetical protein [Moorena producens]WAN69418.1 hypothetical protein BJP36_35595 [Moorena producens JHB]